MPQGHVAPFLSGAVPAASLGLKGTKAQLLTEVQEHTLALGLGPSLRTEYVRR